MRFIRGIFYSAYSAWLAALLCMALLLTGVAAIAQAIGQGTISGLVTDPSGAVIVGAKVTITNINTNVSVERTTNRTGCYEADALNPGEYNLTASSQGFATIIRNGIALRTGAAHLNVTLKPSVGDASRIVEVAARASLLNTVSTSSGQMLTMKRLVSIPVANLNPPRPLGMAPGVQTTRGNTASPDGTLAWNGASDFGANGVTDVNEYSLDGVPNMDGRANGINPAPDELKR